LFERLSVSIPSGSLVVIAGPNGSGKTTLAQLLTGLRQPLRGQILVDGIGLSQLALPWWRQQLIYLAQEPSFLDGSLRENILLARPDASPEQLAAALQDSGLAPWLAQSPQGLDTPVLDGGARLAVGVRKRLSLARALLVGGRLVIADEPFAGLDATGRATHLETLNALRARGATLIIVTDDPLILQVATILIDLGPKPLPRVVFAAQESPANQNLIHAQAPL
jgi:ATP-binding cassette subfamily C protein LapB